MILVDTSVWVEHLRRGSPALVDLLEHSQVLIHPWVVGEIALGNSGDRAGVLSSLGALPRALVACEDELDTAIETHGWYGSGLGYVDAGLLASTMLTPGARLWTRDRRLRRVAEAAGRSM